ncbi:MAG TPA: hypothetical protein VGU45_07945 [Microvirga sp.]|jgi:hypothetical protein|nr:hypothetical protein [Microvirga sp.]
MFKTIAAVAFSLFAVTSAAADVMSLSRSYGLETAMTAGLHSSRISMNDGVAAERAGLSTLDVLSTGSIAQPLVAFMGDGLAAEEASLAAAFDALPMVAFSETPPMFDAADEPAATGSLGLSAWEIEEPALLEAFVAGREAYEATLTP